MADIFAYLHNIGIEKKILHGQSGGLPDYEDGTKVYFHYKTIKCDDERTVLDDSHKHEKPMEIIIGKKFKLEVWEVCLKTMREHEVAEFLVDKKHLDQYPLVAKNLRDIFLKDNKHKDHNHPGGHCCGMMGLAERGLGYTDLDDLAKDLQPLIFHLEVLKIERPGTFEKEVWTLTDEEKNERVPKLKEEGNNLFQQKKYKEAAEKYGEAIGILEQLLLKEKPGDEGAVKIEVKKIPLLLNFSQCKLFLGEFYPVIEHTSTVLGKDPDNVKALYRRAKAHIGAWNPEEAKKDFKRVVELDRSLTNAVNKELKVLEEMQRQKDEKDKEKLKGLFKT